MTKRAGLCQVTEIIDREKLHAENCSELRKRYGGAAAGRAVVELADYVQFAENRVVSEIHAAKGRGARELHMLINSPGGMISSKWKIVAALEAFRDVKRGIVVGSCLSAATSILAACDERIAPPTSELLVHCPGYNHSPRSTHASIDASAAQLAGYSLKLAEFLVARTGSQQFRDMMADGADHTLSAAEARRLNLITSIEPRPSAQAAGMLTAYNYFRPRLAAVNRTMAEAARSLRMGGESFICLKLHGEIGERKVANAATIKKQLAAAPYANMILMFVDSIGGNVDEAAKIYAAIAEHPASKKKAIISRCESAAVLPLMACDLRIAKPSATIMLHSSEFNPRRDDRLTGAQLRLAADAAETADEAIADVLADRTGHDREWFIREMANDQPMRLVDALQCGIIHEIDGVTRRADPSWPEALERATAAGSIMGLPSYLLGENFLRACASATSMRGST